MWKSTLNSSDQTPPDERPTITAVIFDVDGVLTDTASIHYRAWKALFDEILPGSSRFSEDEYDRLVDGKPRTDGLRAVLADRGQLGSAELDRWAERKQELFLQFLESSGMEPFADVTSCLTRLRLLGRALVAVSASRNARRSLDSVGVSELFQVILDGNDAASLGLSGKPEPDLFLAAAAEVHMVPNQCAVVEDALAGVEAGRRGGFGLVIGLDRSPGKSRGLGQHADVVIGSLEELSLGLLTQKR